MKVKNWIASSIYTEPLRREGKNGIIRYASQVRVLPISQQVPHAIRMNDAEPQELVSIRYRDIAWAHVPGATSAYSTWMNDNE
jgi:type VI protein secretion system component Hcp